MKTYDVLAEYLEEYEATTVFSLMSDGTKKAVAKLDQHPEFTVIEARHEQNALAMADGYSRSTGNIGVCIVGRGPAIAQTGTSLVTSSKHGSKVLIVTPESPLSAAHDNKYFRQEEFLETMTNDVVTIRSDEVLFDRMRDVFNRLSQGNGPIAVQIPWDIINAEIEPPADWQGPFPSSKVVSDYGIVEPSDASIEKTLDLYLESDATIPPVVIAGRGAVRSGAKQSLIDWAEQTGAMLATTLQARGYFDDHPYHVGFTGTFGYNVANEFLNEADFVYAAGCSLNQHTTVDGDLVDETTVVHVDTDPKRINEHTPVDLGVVGDASTTTEQFRSALSEAGIDFKDRFWTERNKRRIVEATALDKNEVPTEPGTIDPRDLVRELETVLPEDRTVVTDGGHFINFVLDGISTPTPEEYIWSMDFSSVGQGLPMSVGAAVGQSDHVTVLFCGDSGFMMSLQELNTAKRTDVPLIIVVMNDQVLGSEFHQLDLAGKHADAAEVDTPEFAKVAKSFELDGHTVRSVDDLDEISEKLSTTPETPIVLDCQINREVRHRFYEALHGY